VLERRFFRLSESYLKAELAWEISALLLDVEREPRFLLPTGSSADDEEISDDREELGPIRFSGNPGCRASLADLVRNDG
jgi:hypothetical protein